MSDDAGRRPVIIGCGLTGMAISRALSRKRIDHVLVGDPPGPGMRLGESLNLEGTLDLEAFFPELSDYFHPKAAVVAHVGGEALSCDLELARRRPARLLYRLLGYRPPEGFLHVDRIGFDPAAFDLVSASPHCTHLRARISEVDYDESADTVTGLTTAGGETLEPSFVFDATNHVRLVARRVGLECEFLGTPQRVVYGHYRRRSGTGEEPWRVATHILRLSRDLDPLDGVGWLIPLGDYVSVGLSVDAEGEERSDEELIAIAVDGYAKRGIDLGRSFTGPSTLASIPHQRFYMHERAFGANWLLAGNTYCQVWFGTASGVAAGLAAATCAPRMLAETERYGARYQQLLAALTSPHKVFEWLRRTDPAANGEGELQGRGDVLVMQSTLRLAMYTGLREGALRRLAGRLLAGAIRRRAIDFSGICRGVSAPPHRQLEAVLALDDA